jgi:hypothetical protein
LNYVSAAHVSLKNIAGVAHFACENTVGNLRPVSICKVAVLQKIPFSTWGIGRDLCTSYSPYSFSEGFSTNRKTGIDITEKTVSSLAFFKSMW